MKKYVGTFVVPGRNPVDVMIGRNGVVVCTAFARRRNRLDKAVGFVKACWRWWRVQRLGSRA